MSPPTRAPQQRCARPSTTSACCTGSSTWPASSTTARSRCARRSSRRRCCGPRPRRCRRSTGRSPRCRSTSCCCSRRSRASPASPGSATTRRATPSWMPSRGTGRRAACGRWRWTGACSATPAWRWATPNCGSASPTRSPPRPCWVRPGPPTAASSLPPPGTRASAGSSTSTGCWPAVRCCRAWPTWSWPPLRCAPPPASARCSCGRSSSARRWCSPTIGLGRSSCRSAAPATGCW